MGRRNSWVEVTRQAPGGETLHQRSSSVGGLFIIALVLLVAALVYWADHAVMEDVTRGEGKVIPSSQLQVVQSPEEGLIEAILVDEGAIVEPGEVLVRIDDTSVAASLGELQARDRHLRAAVARLRAEANLADTIAFPSDIVDHWPQIAAGEQALFDTRRQVLDTQVTILERQKAQRTLELDLLESQEEHTIGALGLAREELSILYSTATVPRLERLQSEREVTQLEGDLETTRGSILRNVTAIAEADDRIEDVRLTFRAEARTELNGIQAELDVILASLRGAEDRVTRTEVRSPVQGIVNTLHVTTLGGVVQSGDPLVEIVPIEDTLLVEAEITPADVAFIRPGQDATVKITAYDFSIFGGLDGEIERISADTFTNEETGDDFYRVVVRTQRNHLGTVSEPLPIIPGMVAQIDVLTGERTVLDRLLRPLVQARDEALRER